ncbi:hypothetical protein RF11_09748 [Thelohanellus kitauei]|uniref:Uncharacterized protein n=1 Tax=Thelohanellus kitauei TaxID=669202 RepID=A0A0C2IN97_THEKT|nr:hypothetical protein RF11_09748 [Thelohanellus kitauei]
MIPVKSTQSQEDIYDRISDNLRTPPSAGLDVVDHGVPTVNVEPGNETTNRRNQIESAAIPTITIHPATPTENTNINHNIYLPQERSVIRNVSKQRRGTRPYPTPELAASFENLEKIQDDVHNGLTPPSPPYENIQEVNPLTKIT